jgi:hypothetical protein
MVMTTIKLSTTLITLSFSSLYNISMCFSMLYLSISCRSPRAKHGQALVYTIKDLNFLPRPFEAIFPFQAPRLLFFASCTSFSHLVPWPCPRFLYGERVGRRQEGLCSFVWRQPRVVHIVRHDDSRRVCASTSPAAPSSCPGTFRRLVFVDPLA